MQGRATLEMKVTPKDGGAPAVMTLVLDGYNAPISAGNFMDLVLRKFYDGMEVQRADGFVVQARPPGLVSSMCMPGDCVVHAAAAVVARALLHMAAANFRSLVLLKLTVPTS